MEQGFERILSVIRRLRSPGGCPWDREQTPISIKKYLLEETCELLDAIDSGDVLNVQEEVGDLMFMLLFLACMYEEERAGFLAGALDLAREKMIRRHPHVFGDVSVSSLADVTVNWQAIKAEEAKKKGKEPCALGNIPRSLPALQRAYRLGERASRVGFDWKDLEGVWERLKEETGGLEEALGQGNKDMLEEALGDLLFTVSDLSRHVGINPEETLFKATRRFEERFRDKEGLTRKGR